MQTQPRHYNAVVVIAAIVGIIAAVILTLSSSSNSSADSWNMYVIAGVAFMAVWFYLFPAYVAFKRSAESRWILFSINLLLGWTFLVWIGCLVWATMMPKTTPTVVVHYMPESSNPESHSKA